MLQIIFFPVLIPPRHSMAHLGRWSLETKLHFDPEPQDDMVMSYYVLRKKGHCSRTIAQTDRYLWQVQWMKSELHFCCEPPLKVHLAVGPFGNSFLYKLWAAGQHKASLTLHLPVGEQVSLSGRLLHNDNGTSQLSSAQDVTWPVMSLC